MVLGQGMAKKGQSGRTRPPAEQVELPSPLWLPAQCSFCSGIFLFF
jgi:hypothetical protein